MPNGVVAKNKPIEEVVCSRCYLYTPAWRQRCIHCQEPIANAALRPPLKGGGRADTSVGSRLPGRRTSPAGGKRA